MSHYLLVLSEFRKKFKHIVGYVTVTVISVKHSGMKLRRKMNFFCIGPDFQVGTLTKSINYYYDFRKSLYFPFFKLKIGICITWHCIFCKNLL